MARKSGEHKGAPKTTNAPYISPGLIEHAVEGLANDAGFGTPILSKFRTDIDNELAGGIIPLVRPDGAKSPGVLKKFLRKG